jgi:hypothetical protein
MWRAHITSDTHQHTRIEHSAVTDNKWDPRKADADDALSAETASMDAKTRTFQLSRLGDGLTSQTELPREKRTSIEAVV